MASELSHRLVVVDTGPIPYLVLIGQIDILHHLFGRIAIPPEIRSELSNSEAPAVVREWIANPPAWLTVERTTEVGFVGRSLDSGERAVLSLADEIGASLVLMDDRAGVAETRRRGLAVIGTLGVLDLAASRELLRLSDAFARLRETNFRYPEDVMNALLARHSSGR